MTEHLWVLAGAALGGPARYLVDRGLRSRGQTVLPWGTISVNIVGSFVLGLVLGLDSRHCLPQALTLGIGVGFCGALTTFSTFSYESVRLYESGARVQAIINVLVSVFAALAAVFLGYRLGS